MSLRPRDDEFDPQSPMDIRLHEKCVEIDGLIAEIDKLGSMDSNRVFFESIKTVKNMLVNSYPTFNMKTKMRHRRYKLIDAAVQRVRMEMSVPQ